MSKMDKGAYDLGHYIIYFIAFLFIAVFIFAYVINLFGEKEIDVYRTYLMLKDTFYVNNILNCFLDTRSNVFLELKFTDDTLKKCTEKDAKITLERIGSSEKKVIGNLNINPDAVMREYVILEKGGGVLTIAI